MDQTDDIECEFYEKKMRFESVKVNYLEKQNAIREKYDKSDRPSSINLRNLNKQQSMNPRATLFSVWLLYGKVCPVQYSP